MYRVDTRPLPTTSTLTSTSTTNATLTVPGVARQNIYLASISVGYAEAQDVAQRISVFQGATEIWRTVGIGTSFSQTFYHPIVIQEGVSLVVTTSVTTNLIATAVSLQYLRE